MWGNSPWVRIPLPPLGGLYHNVWAGHTALRVSDRSTAARWRSSRGRGSSGPRWVHAAGLGDDDGPVARGNVTSLAARARASGITSATAISAIEELTGRTPRRVRQFTGFGAPCRSGRRVPTARNSWFASGWRSVTTRLRRDPSRKLAPTGFQFPTLQRHPHGSRCVSAQVSTDAPQR